MTQGTGTRLGAQRRVAAGTALLLALAAVTAGSASAQQLVPLRIGSQTPPIFEYIYINYAIEGGFLRKQGIDGKFVGFTAGLTTTQALAGGSLDAACDGFTGTASAIERGSPAKTVYSVNADNTYVIVTRDTISKIQDLRGKKWAITQMGAISQTYAALWLSKNGLPDNSVDWIPIGGTSARARAVLANQVDATLLTAGEWFRIREQKAVRLLATISDSVPPLPLNLCVVAMKLINERPAVVQGFVNGMLNAVRHARTPEGRQAYIKLAREVDPTGYTDKQYDELYDFYFGPKGNPLAVDPNGGLYPEVYVANMKSMVTEKTLDALMPLEKLVDARFVNQYIGDNGWYDVTTGKSGSYLRDMLKR
ncbi:MAG: NitT/TauT family transport system substrate-binding protein [Alphaproteobacteria bacterium]|jgi:ABC-type nitrate/sulfonate/bicarbonate transport system substrate-binding protein|nr:NitT/TauT family transport system substrate-binding protein [Alphaproteobacteria bacterium]MEA2961823.1 NitT/TauT family transport system substrate-binding protein [Alphaproteobacteria bacterium]